MSTATNQNDTNPTGEGPEILDDFEVEPTPADTQRVQQERIHELEEQTKRMSAEFENFRRRQQEEMKRRQVIMKEEVFRNLLPIVDNLDRSLLAAKSTNSLEALLKGVELIRREFNRLFEDGAVTAIETVDQTFDPNLHEAMMVEERADLPDQSIITELQTGYRLGDRVLRPSMVKISRLPTQAPAESEN